MPYLLNFTVLALQGGVCVLAGRGPCPAADEFCLAISVFDEASGFQLLLRIWEICSACVAEGWKSAAGWHSLCVTQPCSFGVHFSHKAYGGTWDFLLCEMNTAWLSDPSCLPPPSFFSMIPFMDHWLCPYSAWPQSLSAEYA